MSVKVSSWVWHDKATEKLNGNELILLLSLADVADDNGHCRYLAGDDDLTYDGLAEKVRVDRRTIERLIPKLRARGLVEQIKGAKGRPNEFAILVPWAKRSTDKLSENGSQDSPTTATDSPTAVHDSPTAETTFPDNGGSHSSIDVFNVTTRIDVGAAKRGQRIPEPFVVTPSMVSWARDRAPLVNGARSTERFVNYWSAKTGKDATKLDWERTWRNWMLKDQDDLERRAGGRPSKSDRAADVIEMGRKLEAQQSRPAVSA